MSVDREPVVGVALRLRPDGLPLGEETRDQLALIECFEHPDRPVPLEEERDEGLLGPDRPDAGPRFDLVTKPFERVACDAAVVAGGGDGRLESEGRIGPRIGTVRQPDLAVQQHDTRGDRPVVLRIALDGAVPVLVAEPRDRPTGGGHVGHHGVGVAPAPGRRCRVLVLESQHLTRPPGRLVQRDPRTQQRVVALVEVDQVRLDHLESTGHRPPDRLDVAQPAVSGLQIRFQVVGDVGRRRLTLAHPFAQHAEVGRPLGLPRSQAPLDHLAGDLTITGERSGGEECRGRIEVAVDQFELFVDPTDRVAELDAGIPEGIPDRAGDRFDLVGDPACLAVVDEQQVEVAVRSQLAAAVAPDGEEGDAMLGRMLPDGRFEQAHDPGIGDVGERTTVRPSPARFPHSGLGGADEVLGPTVGRHGARSTESARTAMRTPSFSDVARMGRVPSGVSIV